MRGKGITMDLVDYTMDERTNRLLMLMELGEIDLRTYMRENPNMNDLQILYFLQQMLMLLQQIHQMGIIHTDIKPQNFMLYHGKLRIIDFGIAQHTISEEVTSINYFGVAGTVKYMAPEMIGTVMGLTRNKKVHRVSDLWAIGIIGYEMVTGQCPIPFEQHRAQGYNYSWFVNHEYTINWNIKCSKALRDILQGLLEHDDTKRKSMFDIINYPGFNPK